jgi:hypothetical protein
MVDRKLYPFESPTHIVGMSTLQQMSDARVLLVYGAIDGFSLGR